VFQVSARGPMSADTLRGLSTDIFFDMLAVRLDPAKAAGQSMVVNWHFTDRSEKLSLTLRNCTLTHRPGAVDGATVSITMTRETLDGIVLGRVKVPDAIASGAMRIEGDGSRLAALFAMLDPPPGLMFDVLTPGEGR
jgi:alkyl sulfatase BDS1-like metallo-beta-lactamase superfamily hydrolase